jgi:XisI protein
MSISKARKSGFSTDGTEEGIANELVELGIPKQAIVLGYHAPYDRQYTDFAVS